MDKKCNKRFLIMFLCLCCVFIFKSITVNAAISDEAEDYDLGETFNGVVTYETEYYKFVLTERSYVSVEATQSSPYSHDCSINIYNDSLEKALIDNTDLLWQRNNVTGVKKGQYSKYMSPGVYYVVVSTGGSTISYSFRIQAEKQIKLPKGKLCSLKSKARGQMTVKCKAVTNAIGYRIQYSTNNKFKRIKTIYTPTTTYTIKKLKKGQRYYVKVCPYTVYDNGVYVLGQNSYVKSVVVKK